MGARVVVAGVGMIPFAKPGASAPYHEMGAEAGRRALADAGVGYDAVQQAYAGYVYGELDLRPEGDLSARNDRDSRHQR